MQVHTVFLFFHKQKSVKIKHKTDRSATPSSTIHWDNTTPPLPLFKPPRCCTCKYCTTQYLPCLCFRPPLLGPDLAVTKPHGAPAKSVLPWWGANIVWAWVISPLKFSKPKYLFPLRRLGFRFLFFFLFCLLRPWLWQHRKLLITTTCGLLFWF